MVIEPHDADRHEARQERDIRRPQIPKRIAKHPISCLRGNADLENQQRDRDGEYAVAERLDPGGLVGRAGLFAHSFPVILVE